MDLSQFIDTYREAITRQVIDHYPPRYRPAADQRPLPRLLRRPMDGQENAIRGTALSLESQKGSVIVGEMGCGKTFIGAAAAHLAGFRRVLVLAPPHLTRKWQREVRQTIPGAQAPIINSITGLEKLKKLSGGGPLFGILSRERAKLSYRWKPATVERWTTYRSKTAGKVPCCPGCFAPATDGEDLPLSSEELARRRQRCRKCGGALWTADRRGSRRFALADYMKRRMRDFWQLLIADEVHEYKARGSAQGIAAGTLAGVCGKSLTLTGTLSGGYASTLFHLLYRFSPEIRSEFGQGDEHRWVKKYGFEETTVGKKDDDEGEDGRQSRRRQYRKRVRERPGLAPAALLHLIGNSVFLRLSDVASGLPPYDEEVLLTGLDQGKDPGAGISQAEAYGRILAKLKAALSEALNRGSKRLLATYLQTLLAYPDGCTRGETVFDPESGELIVQVPPLAGDKLYPKEKALADLIAAEKLQGRRTLVYVTHTGVRGHHPPLERHPGPAGTKGGGAQGGYGIPGAAGSLGGPAGGRGHRRADVPSPAGADRTGPGGLSDHHLGGDRLLGVHHAAGVAALLAHRAGPPGEGGVPGLPEHAAGRRPEAGGQEAPELPDGGGGAARGGAGGLR